MVQINVGNTNGITWAIKAQVEAETGQKIKNNNLSIWTSVMNEVKNSCAENKFYSGGDDVSQLNNKQNWKTDFKVMKGQIFELAEDVWAKIKELLTGEATKPAEETPAPNDTPAVSDEPETVTPTEVEDPTKTEEPVIVTPETVVTPTITDHPPVIYQPPVADEPPAVDEPPVADETPAVVPQTVDETPVADETPEVVPQTVDETPATDETPAVEASEEVEETTQVGDNPPVTQETEVNNNNTVYKIGNIEFTENDYDQRVITFVPIHDIKEFIDNCVSANGNTYECRGYFGTNEHEAMSRAKVALEKLTYRKDTYLELTKKDYDTLSAGEKKFVDDYNADLNKMELCIDANGNFANVEGSRYTKVEENPPVSEEAEVNNNTEIKYRMNDSQDIEADVQKFTSDLKCIHKDGKYFVGRCSGATPEEARHKAEQTMRKISELKYAYIEIIEKVIAGEGSYETDLGEKIFVDIFRSSCRDLGISLDIPTRSFFVYPYYGDDTVRRQ